MPVLVKTIGNSNNGAVTWNNAAGSVVIGSVSNPGAWTFGPSSFTSNHTLNGGLAFSQLVSFPTSGRIWLDTSSQLRMNATGGYVFSNDNNSANYGTVSSEGAWTLGVVGSTSNHMINGRQITLTSDTTSQAAYVNYYQAGTLIAQIGAGGSPANLIGGGTANYLQMAVTNGIEFGDSANNVRGKMTTAGSWTLGPDTSTSGGSLIHKFQAGGAVTLELDAKANNDINLDFKEAGARKWIIYNDNNTDRLYVRDSDLSNGVYMSQNVDGWTNLSDIRVKKNIEALDKGLAAILAIDTIKFHFNHQDDSASKEPGFSAQQLHEVIPEAVDTHETAMWGVRSHILIPVMVKAIQELKGELEAAKAEIEILKGN